MSTNTPKKNRIDQNAADQKLIDGLTKHAATIPSLVIAGATVANKDIVTTLQARIAARGNAASTRATWRAAVKGEKDENTSSRALVSGVKQALQVMFAGQIEALGDFGMTPRKTRAPIPPTAKVASAEKAKATRAARHTMGSKQKAKITGENPTGATAPVVSPATPPLPAPPIAPSPATTPPATAAATAAGTTPTPQKQ
jgi:hypothetical protein